MLDIANINLKVHLKKKYANTLYVASKIFSQS